MCQVGHGLFARVDEGGFLMHSVWRICCVDAEVRQFDVLRPHLSHHVAALRQPDIREIHHIIFLDDLVCDLDQLYLILQLRQAVLRFLNHRLFYFNPSRVFIFILPVILRALHHKTRRRLRALSGHVFLRCLDLLGNARNVRAYNLRLFRAFYAQMRNVIFHGNILFLVREDSDVGELLLLLGKSGHWILLLYLFLISAN